nr:glycosyltransferase family 1 protein [Thermosipho japonicus]
MTQPVTGVQRYGIELSKAIKKLNNRYNIDFIAPYNIIHDDVAKYLNVKKIGNLRGHLWDQISLLKFLKSKGDPLVVNFSNTLPIFYENKIVTIHDVINLKYPVSRRYRKYYELVLPIMLSHSKRIITVSEFSKEEISSYFGIDKNKIEVIYNGVNEKFKPKKIKNKEKYILGVSSIAQHKNFISLAEAFLKLNTKDVKLYIVGGINEKVFGKESIKIFNNLRNNENVRLFGRVTDDKLIELYSNALCFVFPSLYEGFGIPPLEAQSCGCPVLLSNIPVFYEIYGDSALYFDPLNPDDIASKIEEILYNEDLREILIQKGRENVKKYKWINSAKKFLNVLDKVVQDG